MACELHRTTHRRDDRTKTPTPELPALPDAPEEGYEVSRDLVLLVLEADGPLAVVGLDAVVAEAPARSIESRRVDGVKLRTPRRTRDSRP